jgi:hypothetical protein
MSIQHANRGIVKKDLQLYYNREFSKSFRGEATTNLYSTVGGGAANTYPSAGNSWGTYRDSLYNGGAFGSIGTIASVSGNVVTVSSPTAYFNSFATFDVITPQTTGGGLTANVNYYFKRLSSTTFTLHQYDGTNDGSKTPEQILTYINSDTRIAINATSFPTMWWGAPHLPNVALIKTAITNGFAFDNRLHDCLRLNWFRSDRSDGMAYGVQPAYTANTQYVFSAYIRASSQNAIGGTVSISAYQTGTATNPTITGAASPALTFNWQKWTGTFTSSATGGSFFFYFFPSIATLPATVDIAELQLEQKTYASEFTPTSRSANTVAGGGGLLDISGNNINADLTNVSFNSSGYTFGGSANYIDLPASTFLDFNLNNFSIFTWINSSATANYGNIFNNMNAAGTLGVQFLTQPSNGGCRVWIGNLAHNNTVNVTNGSWNYIGFVRDGDYVYFYVNGSLSSTGTGFAAKNATPNSGNDRRIGRQTTNTDYDFNGQISNFKIYSRLLTAAEVLQNFNATRKTYGV